MASLKDMLDRFIEDGVLTRQEHDLFIEQIHADGKIDDSEKAQISRMFQLIREGKLKIVDEEREAIEIIKKREAAAKQAAAPATETPAAPEKPKA